jgi:hypothetical protein
MCRIQRRSEANPSSTCATANVPSSASDSSGRFPRPVRADTTWSSTNTYSAVRRVGVQFFAHTSILNTLPPRSRSRHALDLQGINHLGEEGKARRGSPLPPGLADPLRPLLPHGDPFGEPGQVSASGDKQRRFQLFRGHIAAPSSPPTLSPDPSAQPATSPSRSARSPAISRSSPTGRHIRGPCSRGGRRCLRAVR